MSKLDGLYYHAYKELEPEKPGYVQLRKIPDINRKKARFFSENGKENPDLKPQINVTEARDRAKGYTALKDAIGSGDTEQVVKDAYIPVLDSNLNGIAMLNAAANEDLDGFIETNIKSYDEPEKLVFDTLCWHFTGLAAQYSHEPQNLLIAEAAKQVLDLLPDTWATTGKLWPSESEFKELKEIYANFFNEMYQGIDLPDKATGEELVDVIERVLKNLGYDYSVVEQDAGVSTMSISHKYEQVKIPFDEVYEASRIMGLLGHELRVHAEETVNGEAQPLMLLGRGLRGSGKAGEGKGVNVEMVAYDSAGDFLQTRRFFDIARRHISIGLARGLDGSGPRDFKEVFEIINALDRLWELTHNPDPENPNAAIVKSLDRTWELLTNRTLKGVVGKGAAYFKDKIYAEERIRQGNLLIRNPDIFPYLNLGHYDLTQREHISILKRISTLPADLDIKLPKK
jgi:hypothetical protein